MDDELKMARGFYGHGRWKAPYWFIGPEPGGDINNPLRAKAWTKLGATELCDCKEYCHAIGEERWHREPPGKPALQPTWRRLMRLLMTFLGLPSDNESLRLYQRDRWARVSGGETCVIELSGLSARKKVPQRTVSFLDERINFICEIIRKDEPEFVVMYGVEERTYWEKIAGCPLIRDGVVKPGATMFAFAPAPNTHGRKDSEWEELGKKLREKGGRAFPRKLI
jgi:hypothetical protein